MKKISKERIFENYAKALYDSAKDEKMLENVRHDLVKLEAEFEKLPELAILNSPLLENNKKTELVADIAQYLKLSDVSKRFLELLCLKRQLPYLSQIIQSFRKTDYAVRQIVEVFVESVQSLTKMQVEKLTSGLEKILKQKVVLTTVIKPDLIGGLIVRFNSVEIDDSIKGKLKNLEQILKGYK